MPLYEYECMKCGVRYERIQKFSDAPLTKCEKCGGQLEKLVSAPSIQFKGSGWYVNDYSKKFSAPVADSSSDSKPSAATESKEKPSEKVTQKTAGTADKKTPS
ncbi:MAG: FmdB family zinc ribbon protein [Terriglobia bacterium]